MQLVICDYGFLVRIILCTMCKLYIHACVYKHGNNCMSTQLYRLRGGIVRENLTYSRISVMGMFCTATDFSVHRNGLQILFYFDDTSATVNDIEVVNYLGSHNNVHELGRL